MSEIIQTIKNTVDRIGRVPDQLRSILVRHSDRGNIPTAGSKEDLDRLLSYARVRAGQFAEQLKMPLQCILNKQIYVFDAQGSEVKNDRETNRFQTMRANGDFGTFSQTTFDTIVQAAASELVSITKEPVKINDVWFDRQGGVVGNDDYDRFEATFGPATVASKDGQTLV